MTLLKVNCAADIFLGMSQLFLDKLFLKAPLKNWLVRVFIFLISQITIASTGLHKNNCQSVIREIRILVKSCKDLKLTEPFAQRYSANNLKTSQNSHKKPMMESFHYKIKAYIFTEELHHRCFPMNFAKFFRIASLNNTSKQMLLKEQLVKQKVKVNCHRVKFIKKKMAAQVFSLKFCKHFLEKLLTEHLWSPTLKKNFLGTSSCDLFKC